MAEKLNFGKVNKLSKLALLRQQVTELEAEVRAKGKKASSFAHIMAYSGDGIVICNEQGNIIEWNPAAETILGKTREELLSLNIWDFHQEIVPGKDNPAAFRQQHKQSSLEFLATGQAPWANQTFEQIVRRADGSLINVETRVFPIEIETGYMAGAIFRDITAKQQDEDQLRKLSRAVEQSPVSVVISDITGAIEYVNPYFTRLTGYSSAEVIGKNPSLLKSGKTSQGEYARLWKTILAGKEWRGEFCNIKKNGEEYWESASISPITDEKGAITHFIAVKEDITSRKNAEKSLKESEAKFHLIFDVSPIGIQLYDANGELLQVNEACMNLFGVGDTVELRGFKLFDDPNLPQEAKNRLLRTGTVSYVTAFNFDLVKTNRLFRTTRSGLVYLDFLITSLPALDGTIAGYLAQVQDISERKLAEQRGEDERELLHICNSTSSTVRMMRELTRFFKHVTRCEAVGVRLHKGEDFPYYETRGFPDYFVKAESSLCAVDALGKRLHDSNGNPILECMCGNILCGRTDPAQPFFTAHGSFWSSNTTNLLTTTTETDRQARTRNRCNGEGYESVALIPLHSRGKTYGLFQFNDRQVGRFNAEWIAWLEHMVDHVAMALDNQESIEALRTSEERYHTVADFTYDWETWIDGEGKYLFCSPSCERITGFSVEELVNNPRLLETIIHPDDLAAYKKHFYDEIKIETNFPLVFRIRTHSGEEKWIEHRCIPVYREDGSWLGKRGSNRDITERSKFLQTLEQRVSDRTRELKIMYELSDIASKSSDQRALIRQSLDLIKTAFPGSHCMAHELNRAIQKNRLKVLLDSSVEPKKQNELDLISSLANQVVEQNMEMGLNEETSYTPRAVIQSVETAANPDRQTSYLGFPITVNQTIWGVLSIYRIQDSFKSDDINLIKNISRQIGIGIETNLLRQQSKTAAVLSERQRVAHELHDSVNQLLYSLALSAQAGQNYINNNRMEPLRQSLQSITDTAQQALQEMRLMIYNLRPMAIETTDLIEALRQRLDFVEKKAGIQVQFEVHEPVVIADQIKEAYYHIAQEALNNVLKYAMAKRVIIRLQVEDKEVIMEIIDDGIGFNKERVPKGIGLDSMQTRAEALGGTLEILSGYKQGTHIIVTVPVNKIEATQG